MPLIVLILARKRAGKTTLARRLLPHLGGNTRVYAPAPIPGDVPLPLDDDGMTVMFREILDAEKTPDDSAVLFDDVDTVFAESGGGSHRLRSLLLHCRQIGISFVLTAKTPSQIPPSIRDNADWIFYQPFREARYLDWLESRGAPTAPPPGGDHEFWVTDFAGKIFHANANSILTTGLQSVNFNT